MVDYVVSATRGKEMIGRKGAWCHREQTWGHNVT